MIVTAMYQHIWLSGCEYHILCHHNLSQFIISSHWIVFPWCHKNLVSLSQVMETWKVVKGHLVRSQPKRAWKELLIELSTKQLVKCFVFKFLRSWGTTKGICKNVMSLLLWTVSFTSGWIYVCVNKKGQTAEKKPTDCDFQSVKYSICLKPTGW